MYASHLLQPIGLPGLRAFVRAIGPFSVCLAGISLVRLAPIVRLFIRYLTRSFIRCFRSLVSWSFIRSHGLCVHPLPSASGFPSCDC